MLPRLLRDFRRQAMLARLPSVVIIEHRGPGRPRTLDYGQVARLTAAGLTQSEVARALGVPRQTVNSAVRRSGDIHRAIQRLHAITSGQRALPRPDFRR